MRDVPERVRDNRRARHREKECNSEIEKFLHLWSPRRRRNARGWLWRRRSIHFSRSAPRADGHLRVMSDPETSGKSCQQRGVRRSPRLSDGSVARGANEDATSGDQRCEKAKVVNRHCERAAKQSISPFAAPWIVSLRSHGKRILATQQSGGPFDPPPGMRCRLAMKVQVPLARQRPKGPGYQPRGQACSAGLA